MLEHMKKRPIEELEEVRFVGAPDKIRKLVSLAQGLGLDEQTTVPWRNAFPDLTDEALPGRVLRGARAKEGLTQKQLAEKSGIAQSHISAMENGKMVIGRQRALRLASALNIGYKVFL